MKFIIYPLCLVLTLLSACHSSEDKHAADLMRRAAAVMVPHPDSALHLLDSITHPEALPQAQYMAYQVRYIQAKDKLYQDIKGDTVVLSIADFFLDKKNSEMAALALFYSGRVMHEQKRNIEATQFYLRALTQAEEFGNMYLLGLINFFIGGMHYDALAIKEAIASYRIACQCFKRADAYQYQGEAWSLNCIGNCFVIEGENDSSLNYCRQALELGVQHNDSVIQGTAYQSMAVTLREMKDLEQTVKYYKRALDFKPKRRHLPRLYRNIGRAYFTLGKLDSAIYYVEQSIAVRTGMESSVMDSSATYRLLAGIEEKKGNCAKALELERLRTTCAFNDFERTLRLNTLQLQRKYELELKENENNRLTISNQRIIVLSLAITLLLCGLSFWLYRRKENHRNHLEEVENNLYTLREMAESFNAKEQTFRNVLLQRFEILKKSALLEGLLRDDEREQGHELIKKFNQAVYGQKELDWNQLYGAMNELHSGFFDKLRASYPQLSEDEFRICCLSYAGFSNTETAIIMKQSIRTVQVKRSSIRHKMGVAEYANINDALRESVG